MSKNHEMSWIKKHKYAVLSGLLILLLSMLRVLAGAYRGPVYYVNGLLDERLMLIYSDFSTYFANENINSLLKYLSFPWMLNLPSVTGLSFNTIYSLSWVLGGLLCYFPMKRLAGRWWALGVFALILFMPQGFETNTGVHFYRNLIIAPFFYAWFGLLTDLFLISFEDFTKRNALVFLILNVCLAWLYPFVYFIKEDSFWMKPVIYLLIVIETGMLIYHLVQICKKRLRGFRLAGIAVCLTAAFLPLFSFQKASADYTAVNQKYFGYPHYTIRTDGEVAGFMERIYKIESPERSLQVWSPYDALEKAFSVSETLKNDPQMRKGIFESDWTNKGESAIGGDYLSWVLVNAIRKDDQVGSAEKAEEYFARVNRELDQAFEDGRLKKDTRIQLTSTAGGRNAAEIAELVPPLVSFYAQMLTFNDFQSDPKYPVEYSEDLEPFLTKLNQDLVYPQNAEDEKRMIEKAETGSKFTRMDFRFYHFVMPVLFGLGLTAWFAAFFLQFGKRETPLRVRLSLILVFFLVALSIGYTIGIVWFSQFLFWHKSYPRMMNVLIYYGPGASSMFYLGIFFAVPLWKWIFARKKDGSNEAGQLKKPEI